MIPDHEVPRDLNDFARSLSDLAIRVFDLGPIKASVGLHDFGHGGGGMLYHGTNSRVLPSILQTGLRPRLHDRETNYPTAPSHERFCYLSTSFAPWYAINNREDDGLPVLIEIDPNGLDRSSAFPDEDFLGQIVSLTQKVRDVGDVTDDDPRATILRAVTEMIPVADHIQRVGQDMGACQPLWTASLDWFGNMAYDGVVPVSAITRYVVQDRAPECLAWQVGLGLQPNITYQVVYAYAMRGLTAHIFDGSSLFAEWDDPAFLGALPRETMMHIRAIKKRMRHEWTGRTRVSAVG